jgi:hypothetical protein
MSRAVAAVLAQKCAHAGIDVPTADLIRNSPFRQEIENEWENMLGHQLPKPLPPFADFWQRSTTSSGGWRGRCGYRSSPAQHWATWTP